MKLSVIQNYKHKIVRHEPTQSDFTSTCKILSDQMQQIFRLSHFVLILTFFYLYVSILQVPFIWHSHFVFLTLAVKVVSIWYVGFEI